MMTSILRIVHISCEGGETDLDADAARIAATVLPADETSAAETFEDGSFAPPMELAETAHADEGAAPGGATFSLGFAPPTEEPVPPQHELALADEIMAALAATQQQQGNAVALPEEQQSLLAAGNNKE